MSSTPTPLIPIPLNTPLLGPNGLLSQPWQWYLYQLAQLKSGGSSNTDIAILESFDSEGTSDAKSLDELQRTLATLDVPAPNQSKRVRDLEVLAALGSPATDQSKRIDDLERLIYALDDSGGSSTTISPVFTGEGALSLMALGDSLTLSNYMNPGAPAASYPGQLQSQIGQVVLNLGVDGYTSADLLSVEVPIAISKFQSGIVNVAAIWIGTNDGILSISAATAEANIAAAVSALQSAGFLVIVCTITPSAYSGNPPSYQTFRTTVNTWSLAGSSGANYVCDVGNDPRLADLNTAPYSTFPSTLYQSDDLHLTAAGYEIIAERVATAIETLTNSAFAFRGGPFAPAVRVATATPVAIAATDFSVNVSCGATPATATLPLARPTPGKIFAVSNTGSVNLTLQTSGSDTLAGSLSSVLISPGCTEFFESDGVSNYLILAYSVFVEGDGLGVLAVTTANGVTISLTGAQQYLKRTTTPYALLATDWCVNMSCGSTAATATLPTAASGPKHVYAITNTGTVNLTVQRSGSDTIGTGAATSVTISPGCTDWFQADGPNNNWVVLAFNLLLANGTGINATLSGNVWTIDNTGVTQLLNGGGILLSGSTGVITISNNGVRAFNGALGAVTGLATTTALSFRSGLATLSGGTVNLAGAHGLLGLVGAGWFLIGGAGNTEFLAGAFTPGGTAFQVWSSNAASTATIQWIAWGT